MPSWSVNVYLKDALREWGGVYVCIERGWECGNDETPVKRTKAQNAREKTSVEAENWSQK